MFVSKEYATVPLSRDSCANLSMAPSSSTTTHVPRSTDVRLIDLGNAVWSRDGDGSGGHSSVIATRHYRAPEVLLGLEWSFPSDMFSVGCILVELFTGEALFQTHHNREHLAMMERCLGPVPGGMISRAHHSSRKYFDPSTLRVIFPEPGTHETTRYVDEMARLDQTVPPAEVPELFDLVSRLLEFDPSRRITASQCLSHPFFAPTFNQHAMDI